MNKLRMKTIKQLTRELFVTPTFLCEWLDSTGKEVKWEFVEFESNAVIEVCLESVFGGELDFVVSKSIMIYPPETDTPNDCELIGEFRPGSDWINYFTSNLLFLIEWSKRKGELFFTSEDILVVLRILGY